MVAVKSFFMFITLCGIVGCLLLSYSYIAGDSHDRDDMHAAAAHVFGR